VKALALLAVAAALAGGCRRPIQPPVGINQPSGGRFPACSTTPQLRPTDNCDGFFTKGGQACVACRQVEHCEAVEYGIYCASLSGCDHDPNCKYIRTPDGGW
jgi:hypothetical protein